MSKDRARRRVEREQVEAAQRRNRAGKVARAGRRRAPRNPLTALTRRRRRPDSILAQRRRRQNLGLVAVLLLLHVLLWTQVPGWGLRATAAILTLLLWPVLVTVAFDRRSST